MMGTKSPETNYRHLRKVREWREAEQQRVDRLIAEARADRSRRKVLAAAEIEVADGKFINLSETVIEPTPEWMAKGETRKFSVSEPGQTARTMKATRRVFMPPAVRLYRSGSMTEDQAKACLWYREIFEIAGLEGRYSSGRLGPEMSLGASSGSKYGGAAGHIPMTQHEAYARQMFRAAQACIPAPSVDIFDKFALEEVPVKRLIQIYKTRHSTVRKVLIEVAQRVANLCEDNGFDLSGIGRDIDRA